MLVIAPYAEEESAKAGATLNQFKSGVALAQRAALDVTGIDYEEVEVTISNEYRAWWRLKDPKSGCRVFVEIFTDRAVLHAVVPRDSNTYYSVEDLWKKYRSRK